MMTRMLSRACRTGARAASVACRWRHENEILWMRVLFCDWIRLEGLSKGSFNPPESK